MDKTSTGKYPLREFRIYFICNCRVCLQYPKERMKGSVLYYALNKIDAKKEFLKDWPTGKLKIKKVKEILRK